MLQKSILLTDEEIKTLFGEEKVFINCEVKKYNDYGFWQDRVLVVTDLAIYNLKKKAIKRRI